MADRIPTGTRQDGDRIVLSVPEAAARLGVTPDAIRARLHRGTLFGVKTDGEWRVHLDPLPAARQEPTGTPPVARQDTRQDATGGRQDGDRHTDELPAATVVAVYEQLVESQREEIVFLRDQLDHSRRELADERQRFDVIHREALGRIEALTAGETARPSDTPAPDSARPEPAGEATGAPETIGTHRESVVLSVWRRLFGRG
jgi:hypothetical protein